MKIFLSFFLFLILPLFCFGDISSNQPTKDRLDHIDEQLQVLRERRRLARLQSMKEEISGQRLIFEEWEEYADRIQSSEKYSEEADKIQKQIDVLEAHREKILSEQNALDQKL
jgi:hypothetical protein